MADPAELVLAAEAVAQEVTREHAREADRDARFPHETLAALREAGALSLPVPAALGGPGGTLEQTLAALRALAAADASVGVIMTMHWSQLLVLARHASTDALRGFLTEAHEQQLLVANSNSERDVAGSDRRSRCTLHDDGPGWYRLEKQTPVISYGEQADAYLVTTRHPDAAENDQVLALARRADVELEPLGEWDAMGFRATRSRPFALRARVAADMVVEDYRQVVDATGLPVTYLLHTVSLVGMAESAAEVARRYVRRHHRGDGEAAVVGRLRLAELMLSLDELRGLYGAALRRWQELDGTPETASLGFVSQLQSVKVAGTRLNLEVALAAMRICGIAAYREDSEWSLSRAVRDAVGSTIMLSNDPVLVANGHMALLRKAL